MFAASTLTPAFATHYYSGNKWINPIESYKCDANLTNIHYTGISPCTDLSGPATTWTNAPGKFELVFYSGSDKPVKSGDLGTTGTLAQAWVPTLFGTILSADITFNSNAAVTFGNANTNPSVYDYQSVALHEFGHWVKYNHAPETSSVMYASIGVGVVKRTLNSHDSSGMGTIYQ
ncbi:MAG: matrixin family metalloprotease [Candidatus Nitrosotenuis sp.]